METAPRLRLATKSEHSNNIKEIPFYLLGLEDVGTASLHPHDGKQVGGLGAWGAGVGVEDGSNQNSD